MLLEIIDIAKYANVINDFVLFDKTVKKLCDIFDRFQNEKNDALLQLSFLSEKIELFKNDGRIKNLLKNTK